MINHILWILQLMPHIYSESALFNFGHIKIEKEKDDNIILYTILLILTIELDQILQ